MGGVSVGIVGEWNGIWFGGNWEAKMRECRAL